MILGEILENAAVSVEKTVWQKRGDKITCKNVSRLLATASEPQKAKVNDGE
jgi:hypothetical protein